MTRGPEIPERMRVVLMQRCGLGWRVGIGTVTAGEIETGGEAHADERSARKAALALSDSLDLMVLRT